MDNQQQMEEERYQNALLALTDAALCGCKLETLQTMRFEFGLDARDFETIVQHVLKSKFSLMEMSK